MELGESRGTTLLLAGTVLWLPVLNNLVSTRSVGAVALTTTVLKIGALGLVAVVGLALFDAGNIGSMNARDGEVARAARRLRAAAAQLPGDGGRTGLARRTRELPALALLVNSTLATILIVVNATGDALDLFTTLALLSTFVYVFGYVLSVAAQLLHALRTSEGAGRGPSRPQVAVAGLALAFSIWMAGATGAEAVQAGTVMLLPGIPAYVLMRARRGVTPLA